MTYYELTDILRWTNLFYPDTLKYATKIAKSTSEWHYLSNLFLDDEITVIDKTLKLTSIPPNFIVIILNYSGLVGYFDENEQYLRSYLKVDDLHYNACDSAELYRINPIPVELIDGKKVLSASQIYMQFGEIALYEMYEYGSYKCGKAQYAHWLYSK